MTSVNIKALLGVYNVRDYGFVQRPSHDNAGAINAAVIAAHLAGGGTVLLPPDGGVVGIGSTVELFDDVELVIPAGVTLKLLRGSNVNLIENADQVGGNRGLRISGGGTIDGNRTEQTAPSTGILLCGCEDSRITGVTVESCRLDGIRLTDCLRTFLDVVARDNCRDGLRLDGSTEFTVGIVVAYDNGQCEPGNGVTIGGSSSNNTLVVSTPNTPGSTQQYGVQELPGSTGSNNTVVGGALPGNTAGGADMPGSGSSAVLGPISHDDLLDVDTNTDPSAIHHTLGAGTNQAAPGDHTHAGTYLAAGAGLGDLDGVSLGTPNEGDVLKYSGEQWVPAEDAGAVKDILYADLCTAIVAGDLAPGTWYRITDYRTVHYIVDGGGTQYPDSIITGPIEPLIVQALSSNTLGSEAKSALHPQDAIHYDWDPAHWSDDLSFAIDSVIVPGFAGVITFRHDTLLDNYAGFDWRHCKFRRWKTNVPAWNAGTAYTAKTLVSHESRIWVALKASTGEEPDPLLSDFWAIVLDISTFEYWNSKPGSMNGIPSSSEFADFTMFAEGPGTASYELCCRSNHFEAFKDNSSYFEITGSLLPNNVIFLGDDEYYCCYCNQCSPAFVGNTIGPEFYRNVIGEAFQSNIVGSRFFGNRIEDSAYENVLGSMFRENVIGTRLAHNDVGEEFEYNQVGANFYRNVVGKFFRYNQVGYGFDDNVLGHMFQMNQVDDAAVAHVDFTSATHVYGEYNTTIYKRPDGGVRLRYFDNTDALTVVAANA